MKALTASVYTFENLIRGDFLYIDKTEYLWNLVQPAQGIYFLSRPRRFGKSLTLSTLKAIFQGKRELFKGLAIDGKPYDWKEYPIVHLDFGNCAVSDPEQLREYLFLQLESQARQAGVNPHLVKEQIGLSCSNLISSLNRGNGVVVLVDEYDKPILNNLSDKAQAQAMLSILKGFYSALKTSEANERFVFVTGVTKFCHVSLFSDLNNLQDISMNPDYATMLGYTQEELEGYFQEWLAEAESRQPQPVTHDVFLAQIKAWYDGYRFEETAESVYNPVSLANFFINHGKFSNYWFATGTTSSLFQLMRQSGEGLPEIMEGTVTSDLFESFDLASVDLRKLMYQTGYLTIGETEAFTLPGMPGLPGVRQYRYRLRFPNYEVRSSFNNQVMAHYAGLQAAETLDVILTLAHCLQTGNVEGFMEQLKRLFARIPYSLHGRQEHDYQTILYVIFLMLNMPVQGEYHTNEGRIDLVLAGEKWTYVIELKLNGNAEEAMQQIQNRDYARGFLGQGRRVIAVGVNFDSKKAQIDNWLTEEVTP